MTIQTFKLYICKDVSQYGDGKIHINDFNLALPQGSRPSDYVLLGVTLQAIEVPEIDHVPLQVEELERSVKMERAESQSRVNFLLERISKLKAIGHDQD